jgi:hypothetical protein
MILIKNTVPKPVGLGNAHQFVTALSSVYRAVFKCLSSLRQAPNVDSQMNGPMNSELKAVIEGLPDKPPR